MNHEVEVEEFSAVLDDQRRELMAAKTLNSDLDFAFNLQMQEALSASLSNNNPGPSTSCSSPAPPQSPAPRFDGDEDGGFDYMDLLLEDIDRYDQEQHDHMESKTLINKMKCDLDLRTHDYKLAREIMNIPEHEWKKTGEHYQKPYHDDYGKGLMNESEGCRIYFKGLVSEERIKDIRVVVAAIGVAICDFEDNMLFEMKRGLENGMNVGSEEAELEALVAGLETAMALSLGRVTFFCDNYLVHQYVSGKVQANQSKIATLVNQVADLRNEFSFCKPSFVTDNKIKFAFRLAREAIVSQVTWSVETQGGKSFKETCVICFEDIDAPQMFSVDDCLHRFCFSCMKQHVEVKLLNGKLADCPHEGCGTDIDVDSYGKLLDPRLVEIMNNRMKESSISITDRVYCPYPKCSALMSKVEVLAFTEPVVVDAKNSGARKCMKCYKYFCINCKVPWHYKMTCDVYKKSPKPPSHESMVKSLAKKRKWRQCVKCNNMVELATGCYHIYCRCGYEFCYTCGAEWKKKQPTCKCPIWDERNIIHG